MSQTGQPHQISFLSVSAEIPGWWQGIIQCNGYAFKCPFIGTVWAPNTRAAKYFSQPNNPAQIKLMLMNLNSIYNSKVRTIAIKKISPTSRHSDNAPKQSNLPQNWGNVSIANVQEGFAVCLGVGTRAVEERFQVPTKLRQRVNFTRDEHQI